MFKQMENKHNKTYIETKNSQGDFISNHCKCLWESVIKNRVLFLGLGNIKGV